MGKMIVKLGDETSIGHNKDLARLQQRMVEREVEMLLGTPVTFQLPAEDRACRAIEIANMAPNGIEQTEGVILIRRASYPQNLPLMKAPNHG